MQSEAMYYSAASPRGGKVPAQPFTNCSVFGCTCQGAADFYGISGSFGCADKGSSSPRPSSNSTRFLGTCWSLPWAFCGIGYGW